MSLDANQQLKLYAAAVTALAGAFAAALILADQGIGDAWTVVVLAGVNAVAERGSVQLTRTTQLSIALLPTLFAAVLFGPVGRRARQRGIDAW